MKRERENSEKPTASTETQLKGGYSRIGCDYSRQLFFTANEQEEGIGWMAGIGLTPKLFSGPISFLNQLLIPFIPALELL